jgi:hypothetical protein
MRITAGVLATFALALTAQAQTEAPPVKATGEVVKLWKIETSGIGG